MPQHGIQQGGIQPGGMHQGGGQPGGMQQNGVHQGNAPQGGVLQDGTSQSAYQNGPAAIGAAPINPVQNGPAPAGPASAGPAPGGPVQNGIGLNGAQSGYQAGAQQNGMQQGGYHSGPPQNGAQPGDLYGGSYGAGSRGAPQAGFDAAPTAGQQHYSGPSQGYFPDQPGVAGADQRPRNPFPAQQPALGPGTAFPPQIQYGAPGHSVAQVPAVRSVQAVAISLPDAVKAAHSEGFSFGESVGRDAPALWLDAVLARKPRMPSDLEARLLQGSALPIDSLLHDEVRHSLRRGFWDALENARR
jgi:hypothetical protein